MRWRVRHRMRLAGVLCAAALIALPATRTRAETDDKPGAVANGVTLNDEQLQAVGLRTARPVPGKTPERIAAFGLVLDPATLVTELGEMEATRATQQTAAAESARLRGLYSGAGTALKTLETAQAELARARAQADAAQAHFARGWAALAALAPAPRQQLIDAVVAGRHLLLRADVPGRQALALLPARAMLDVDGIQVPGRVLGYLAPGGESLGVAVLLDVENAPAGLGPGARLPVALLGAPREGLLLPRTALLYDEHGAYVFEQQPRKPGEKTTAYTATKVTLLAPLGDGWLVEGVDDDDAIVVHGAGVLWSLLGVNGHAIDDDD